MRAKLSTTGQHKPNEQPEPPRRRLGLARLEKALAAFIIALGIAVTTIFFTLRLWPQPYFVVMRVEGTSSSLFISYSQGSGTKFTMVDVPWESSFYAGSETRVSLQARPSSRNDRATCEIWVNGMPWKSDSVAGGEGSASCGGMLGGEEEPPEPALEQEPEQQPR